MEAMPYETFQQIVEIIERTNVSIDLYYSSPVNHKNWIDVKGLITIGNIELERLSNISLGYCIFNSDPDIDEVDGLLKMIIFTRG